jgi:hypothetical protein
MDRDQHRGVGVRLQCLQQRETVGHADDLSGT